jgi:hypothetical protein
MPGGADPDDAGADHDDGIACVSAHFKWVHRRRSNSSRSPRPDDIQIGPVATVQGSLLLRDYESRSTTEIWNIPISDQVTSPSMRGVKLKGPWRDPGLCKL